MDGLFRGKLRARFFDNPRIVSQLMRFCYPYLGSAEKVFRWGLGVGGWGLGVGVWGVGFYPFSGGQLPNFQGKSP
jgi:putative transposase